VYDENVHGSTFWRVDASVMGVLARTGLTLSELAALYFSRALIECFAGTALRNDITSAFDKLEAVVPPKIARLMKERTWHASQHFNDRPIDLSP